MKKILRRVFRNKGCSLWWCSRAIGGYVRILFQVTEDGNGKIFHNIPYCLKHGEMARQLIDEGEIKV